MFEKEKEFDGKIGNIPSILGFINDFAKEHEFPDAFTNKILIVGDELFSNIIKYGYENEGGSIMVKLSFEETVNEFCLTIIDKAKEFNQLSVNNVDENNKGLRIGGLGIFIVKQIMTECAYERADEQNVLILKKRF